MGLLSLHIKNFKSIVDFKIDNIPDFAVFAGTNGSGKSNIFEALECPQNIAIFIEQAKTHNPDKIIILTDLECDPSITQTKERLGDCDECIIIIARKSFEAWFLADDALLSNMTNGNCRHFNLLN